MTVEELINILAAADPKAVVLLRADYDATFAEVSDATLEEGFRIAERRVRDGGMRTYRRGGGTIPVVMLDIGGKS